MSTTACRSTCRREAEAVAAEDRLLRRAQAVGADERRVVQPLVLVAADLPVGVFDRLAVDDPRLLVVDLAPPITIVVKPPVYRPEGGGGPGGGGGGATR